VAAAGTAWLPSATDRWLAPALRWAAATVAVIGVLTLLYPDTEPDTVGPVRIVAPVEEFQYVGRLAADHPADGWAVGTPFVADVSTNLAAPVLRLKAASGEYRGGGLLPVSFEY